MNAIPLYKNDSIFVEISLFGGDINVQVDLYNYATKADLKNATGIDTSKLAAKPDLVSLKAEVDKLDIDKLMPLPAYLSKLSDVVKNIVVKKTVYGKLVAKENSIDISGFVLKKGMTQINQI